MAGVPPAARLIMVLLHLEDESREPKGRGPLQAQLTKHEKGAILLGGTIVNITK